ncbi:MAG TPA: cytochrome c biogenesis protein CcsA [Pirellulales bacterium]|nr:cytochrome c biogenesis protein CcsA [Pirellulales bacterium]
MATNTLPEVLDPAPEGEASGLNEPLRWLLMPLASLKITVVSFALAIFLVLAGTLAQIDQDIWRVMGDYFRTPIAWIPFQIFVPRTIELRGGMWFPGGFTIGTVMLLNLLAAHALRFKVQARGGRLAAGLAILAVGALLGWLVVVSGSNKEGIEDQPLLSRMQLWELCKWGLLGLWIADLVALLRTPGTRRLERWLLAAMLVPLGGFVVWLFYEGDAVALSAPSMRILWQLVKASLVGLVLLAGCVLLFRKRAGIVLLHAGVGLMMLNELIVYSLHTEGQMQIREGETVNYVQDIRTQELAIVDRSNPEHDDVVVVPQRLLEPDARIEDKRLPFEVQVLRYLQNTNLRQLKAGEENLADAGQGVSFVVDEARPSSGTDMGGGVDMSAAYVKFVDKESGKSLGTHLLSLYPMFDHEQVKLGDKTYDVALRFKRDYKPYSLQLIDVRFDKYVGTNTPRNYSSDVRLLDPSRNVDRKVKIWMNNPLRYAGETFYQSTFNVDPMSRKEMTGLQVVTNTGWMIPYVGCMIVVIGMLAQFGVVLLRFLRREFVHRALEPRVTVESRAKGDSRKSAELNGSKSRATWLVPLSIVVLGCVWFGGFVSPHRTSPEKMQLDRFGELPVVYEGRMKPFDTLARNSLRVISDREYFREAPEKKKSVMQWLQDMLTFRRDPAAKRQPAIKWLLDVITNSPAIEDYQVVRIYNPEVLQVFGLEPREGFRYAIKELQANLTEFEKQVELAEETPAHKQTTFHKKLIELNHRLRTFLILHAAFEEPAIGKDDPAKDVMRTAQSVQKLKSRVALPLAVPPDEMDPEWEPYTLGILRAIAMVMVREEPSPQAVELRSILVAYAANDPAAFNEHVAKYGALLEKLETREAKDAPGALGLDQQKMDFEAFFNRSRAFFACQWSYFTAFVLAVLGWLVWNKPLHRAALMLMILTVVVHTLALAGRIYISGRPPVTNLYSSAVFIGWGAVLFGIVLEWLFGLGIGNVIASVAGFSTLVIADKLAGDGDTFTVLQAVLDTQFWLATHVVCITLGYATTYVAGLLGLIYIALGFFTTKLTAAPRRDLTRMTYGVLCFAIFFSFWGTVLGGLWADDSWGRFWGWDPKENGALIIVLWNALVLHARWDGMVKDRGLAVLTVAGNIAVSWSWFGVNQLGAGLHSYGFTEGVALALAIFVVSQLGVIIVGSLPKALWRSYRAELA